MIRNVIFDVGGVLADVNFLKLLAKYRPNPIEIKKVAEDLSVSKEWDGWNRGLYTTAEIGEILVEKYPKFEKMVRKGLLDDWDRYLEVDKTMASCVRSLKKAGYKVYLLADLPKEFCTVFEKNDVFKNIDGSVFSHELHSRKPEQKMYDELVNRYGLKPEECLYVDDNGSYLKPAERMGMKTLKASKPQETVKALMDILNG